jgi:CPA1 family monovalent cation:H+ antiporter
MIVYITYVVVLFSIIVQGLSIGKLANRIYAAAPVKKVAAH